MLLRTLTRASLAILCLAALAPAARGAPAGASEPYTLGPADRLRITVSQWVSAPTPGTSQWAQAAGDFQTRLDGQFAVDTAGNLSLPLVGEIPVEGRTAREVSRTIAELFQAKLGTVTTPGTSVEIIEYRPFYTVGVVDRPGAYPYRPGMTVLHALTLSGGLYRRPDTDLIQLQRDLVTAAGDAALQAVNRDIFLGRVARLEAEFAGKDAISFPSEILARRNEPAVARVMADEAKVMKQRQDALRIAIASQLELKRLGESQNTALEGQSAAVERQMAVAKKELEDQTELVNRGLARRPLLFPIDSRLAEAEGKVRQLQSDILKNAQDIKRAEQAAIDLRTNRQTEILDQLKEAQGNLEQIRQKLATDTRMVTQTDGEVQRRSGEARPVYSILRREGDAMQERPVTETTTVLPGDIVRVVLPGRGQGAEALPAAGPTAAIPSAPTLQPARFSEAQPARP